MVFGTQNPLMIYIKYNPPGIRHYKFKVLLYYMGIGMYNNITFFQQLCNLHLCFKHYIVHAKGIVFGGVYYI